jgi:carbonic anhydrase
MTAAVQINPQAALQQLKEGNRRFASAALKHPNQDETTRLRLVKGQSPVAIILGCSDSRISPEILFDQGLGDLFVVRAAGNPACDVALWSAEYAVAHLGVPLLVVLGHSGCGALTAAVENTICGQPASGLLALLEPAVRQAQQQCGDLLENTITCEARQAAHQLAHSGDVLPAAVQAGKLVIQPAVYHQTSGLVEWL